MTVDTKKYLDFVAGVTSMPSQDSAILQARIDELVANGADIPPVSYTHLRAHET